MRPHPASFAPLLGAIVLAFPAAGGVARAAEPVTASATLERIDGVLPDGTRWIAQKPENWNGTLLLDLDAAPPAPTPGAPPRPPNPFSAWLFARGYAIGGITREPVGYDFPKAVDYILGVRDRFIARWGQPKRTLITGNSRGAFVVRKALELRPDIFAGGFMSAGGGAGEIAVLRNKLNGLFVLKTLVDPAAPLRLVDIDGEAENRALTALVAKARATPQGRARLALAAAVQQFALWTSRDKPKPAPTDYEAQLEQIADNYVFATAVPVRAGVEKIAGGNVSWNTDADYIALLAASGRRPMVEALYRTAGLDLTADLATLARAPRIKADPQAVRRAEPLMTYTGRIQDPVMNVDNDDPVDPASDKLAYVGTLKRAGTSDLYRLIWADSPGHSGMSALDRAVGFKLLIDRIDTGRWGDTSLPALQVLGAELARASPVDLGRLTLFEPQRIPAPANTWDSANWGSYGGR